MRDPIACVCLALFMTATPALAQFHPDARKAYQAHWNAHHEHPEQLVRLWHQRLFHREIAPPLLARLLEDLRRGIEAPLALAHLLASPEYYLTVGNTPEGFVRHSFVEVVGRQPTESEYRFWLHRMYHADRVQVAHEMVTRYPPAWVVERPVPVESFEYRTPIVRYHR